MSDTIENSIDLKVSAIILTIVRVEGTCVNAVGEACKSSHELSFKLKSLSLIDETLLVDIGLLPDGIEFV